MRCNVVSFKYVCKLTILISCLLMAFQPEKAQSQDYEDVFLSFRYQGVPNYIIDALYFNNEFYLPVTELFNILEINYSTEHGRFTISGMYLEASNSYRIDFQNRFIELGNNRYTLQTEDFILTDFGYFLSLDVFDDVFGLNFTIDLGNLMVHLRTDKMMPVTRRIERERMRSRIEMVTLEHQNYPLIFDRDRKIIDGAFVDYSLTSSITNSNNNYNYYIAGGAEILGGDIQGNITGNYTYPDYNYIYRDVRWRYVFNENPYISRVSAGQLSTIGLHQRSYNGFQISNEPIRPRRYFDEYVLEGTAEPESELEIYVNNQLYDFKYADELGNYRFTVPLMYGNSRVQLKSYRPDGSISEMNRRLQVPFNFVPQDKLTYNLSVGQVLNPVRGFSNLPYVGLFNAGFGAASWLTPGGGAEYYDNIHDNDIAYYGRASLRFFQNHLLNLNYVPNYFYGLSADALYSNAISWRFNYKSYQGSSIYNQIGVEEEFDGSIFLPFNIGQNRFSYRVNLAHQIFPQSQTSRISTDLNMRVKRFNIRFGYRESIRNIAEQDWNFSGTSTASVLYTFSRRQDVIQLFSSLMVRGQISYLNSLNRFERADLTVTRAVSRRGRFRLNVSHSFLTDITTFEAGLVLDFNRAQSTSTVRTNTVDYGFRQNVRGSIGFDSNDNSFHASNRHQVGRAAASVRMFIDNTGSGTYEEGDQLITDNAIRLTRVGGRTLNEDGVTRITNLMPYDIHNLEINQAMITNPLLIPAYTELSFVADPNAYKPIDIPFYMGGEVEGEVTRIIDGRESYVSGLRILLINQETEEVTTVRTFSNGQFYSTQLRPGQYIVKPDSVQIRNLRLESRPEQREITIEPLAFGDLKTDMNFLLTAEEPPVVPVDPEELIAEEELTDDERIALEQLGGDMQRLLDILSSDEGLDGVLCAYRVTISSQASLARTHVTILDSEEEYGRRFHARFVGGLNSFAIMSDFFIEESDALTFRDNMRQVGYQDAFVTEECRPFPDNFGYQIVFDETESEERALSESRRIQQTLGIEVIVEYVEDRGTYIVQTPETEHFSEILAVKTNALQQPGFSEVTIAMDPEFTPSDIRYILQLAAFPNSELAEEFAVQVMEDLNTEIEVIRNFRTNLYEVRMLPEEDFGRAIRMRQMIKSREGYEPPVILTITGWID